MTPPHSTATSLLGMSAVRPIVRNFAARGQRRQVASAPAPPSRHAEGAAARVGLTAHPNTWGATPMITIEIWTGVGNMDWGMASWWRLVPPVVPNVPTLVCKPGADASVAMRTAPTPSTSLSPTLSAGRLARDRLPIYIACAGMAGGTPFTDNHLHPPRHPRRPLLALRLSNFILVPSVTA
jgi:hypothetical protein